MSINKKYIYITVLLLFIELIIAVFVRDRLIRPFFGDFLVVMLLFFFFKIYYKGSDIKLGGSVLLFAFAIEVLQYFQLIEGLGLQNNKIATVILGATFDGLDLVAYLMGVLLAVSLDRKLIKS